MAGANLDTKKRRIMKSLYLVRTRCGMYGGYCVVVAHDPEQAAQLTNELLKDANCRVEVDESYVTLIHEGFEKMQPFAYQVWDGHL